MTDTKVHNAAVEIHKLVNSPVVHDAAWHDGNQVNDGDDDSVDSSYSLPNFIDNDEDSEDDSYMPKSTRMDELPKIEQLCKLIRRRATYQEIEKYFEENQCSDYINHCFKKWTPLLYATATDRLDVCQLLVRNGADVNFVPSNIPENVIDLDACLGYSQLSPFMMSCYRCVCFEIFDLFFCQQQRQFPDMKAIVNLRTPRDGYTALTFLVWQTDWSTFYSGIRWCSMEMQLQKLEMLLAIGADVTLEYEYGDNTVLHKFTLHYMMSENEDGYKQLDSTDEIQAYEKEEKVILTILQKIVDQGKSQGIDLNKTNHRGMSALRKTLQELQADRVELFLRNGADITETRYDKTLVHELSHDYEAFLQYADDLTIVKFKETFEVLLRYGINIHLTAFSGNNFLHLLARNCGRLPIRKAGIFLGNGCGGEINGKNNFGMTPLHFSIMHNELRDSENPEKEKWFRFAEFLIDNGADLNTRAKSEVTPLMTAARGKGEGGHGYVSLILSKNPSSLHDTDKFSRTVLHHCVIFASTQKFFQMIVNSEIDPNITDVYGHKAVYYTQFLENAQEREIFQQSLGHQIENSGYLQYRFVERNLTNYFIHGEGDFSEGERMIRLLRETPGIGSVRNITERSVIDKKVAELMQDVSLSLTENCKFGYRYSPRLSGGVGEGTKVGFPDEYDYLIFVEGLDKQLMVADNDDEAGSYLSTPTTKPGHIMMKFKDAGDDAAIFAARELSKGDSNDDFDASKFNHYFRGKLYASFSSVVKDDVFYFLQRKLKNNISEALAAIEFTLHYPTMEFGDKEVSIDIVPVIRLPVGLQPKCLEERSILQGQDRLCATLLKPAKSGLTSGPIVPHNNQLRISTSLVETRIIQQMPTRIKEAFIALKAINTISREILMANSYVIKNAVIRYAIECNGDDNSANIDNDHANSENEAESVLGAMIAIITRFKGYSYFFPEMRISNIEYPDREDFFYANNFKEHLLAIKNKNCSVFSPVSRKRMDFDMI